jgi:hypothetical protein
MPQKNRDPRGTQHHRRTDPTEHGVIDPRGTFHPIAGARAPVDVLPSAAARADRTGERVKLGERKADGTVIAHGTVRPSRLAVQGDADNPAYGRARVGRAGAGRSNTIGRSA